MTILALFSVFLAVGAAAAVLVSERVSRRDCDLAVFLLTLPAGEWESR